MRSRSVGRPRWTVGLLVVLLALPACRARAVPGEPAGGPPARLSVLVVNGGGAKAMNYQSHFLHVRHLLDLLDRAGVPRERITVFSSDGSDPAADMAVREVEPGGDFWLLRGTRLEGALGPQIVYANSELAGVTLQAATKAGLKAWFRTARTRLRAGDTLLLYVTDHGAKNAEDTSNNRITLWGDKEAISVRELRALVEQLDPGVRVVALMSQCFSGAFANLRTAHAGKGVPRGSTCGYFSSTPDRMAYGCYPENRGKDNVGHAFHFLQALETTRSLAQAHAEVLVTDHTPDVPIRTSDAYLDELLDRAAKAAKTERTAFVDGLLREAWRDKAVWEPDIRLLDRTAHAFGLFSPRSLEELEQQTKRLPDVSEQLSNHGKAWRMTVGDLAEANLGRFLGVHPDWGKRVDSTAMATLDASGRQALAGALLTDLAAYTDADATTAGRLRTLRERAETASAAAYRMEVRLAAVLRLRGLLSSIAGRVWLAAHGTPAERTAYERLGACEDLRLGAPPASPTVTVVTTPEPFPPYDDDVQLAEKVLPAWMGINFRQANEKTRTEQKLKEGAAAVLTVYPDSPAQSAGLEVGDLIIGPPGHPFIEPHQVREWTMLSPIDRPAPLVVQRGDRQVQLTLVPKPYPVRLPELPGPPKVGSAAPTVPLNPYRGTLPTALADGKPHLLFFWATWCAPCKASIPELLAFEGARSTQVIAITDEPSDQLDAFFKHYEGPFPGTVATDELRRAFQAFGVSGTPSFVLVDAAGNVAAQATGYTPEKGLGIEGWKWTKDAAPSGG